MNRRERLRTVLAVVKWDDQLPLPMGWRWCRDPECPDFDPDGDVDAEIWRHWHKGQS